MQDQRKSRFQDYCNPNRVKNSPAKVIQGTTDKPEKVVDQGEKNSEALYLIENAEAKSLAKQPTTPLAHNPKLRMRSLPLRMQS